jgi:LacI family transcriptional regulator
MSTMEQIAEAAGVTRATVSKVLGDGYQVQRSDAVRRAKEIRRIAAEMGYRPHSAARAIRTGRFHTVGMLTSAHGNRSIHNMGLIYGLMDELSRNRLHLSLSKVPDERLSSTGFVPRMLSELCVDGVVINYIDSFPPHMRRLIETHAIPSVWLNTKLDHDCVYPDDLQGATDATNRLLELGHRRIAYVHFGQANHYSATDRRAGYEHAMSQAGLKSDVWPAPSTPRQAGKRRERMRQVLAGSDRPTAILGYSHSDVYPALIEARALGMSIPEDLSLVTFADRTYDETDYHIAYVHVHFADMGRAIGRMMVEKIAQPTVALPAEAITLNLNEGTTLAAWRGD